MTKRELIINNIHVNIKSNGIKRMLFKIFSEYNQSSQISTIEVIIWSGVCEKLKMYDISDLDWHEFCSLQNVTYIELLSSLNENIFRKYTNLFFCKTN